MELKCDICRSKQNGQCKGQPYESCEDADKLDAKIYKNAADNLDKDRHPRSKYSSRLVAEAEKRFQDAQQNQRQPLGTVSPEIASKRYSKLVSWRLTESRKQNRPAYFVFTNDELHAISEADIRVKADLLFVKGIGQAKYDKYADALFQILTT